MAHNICETDLGNIHFPDFHDGSISPQEGVRFIFFDGALAIWNLCLVYLYLEDVHTTEQEC